MESRTPDQRNQESRTPDQRNQENRPVGDETRRGRENTVIPEHTREPPPPTEPAPFGANPKPPLKILNLDSGAGADWLDFSEPAPMELITAIYENSKDGPVTIWSKRLAEANFAAQLWNWILDTDNTWRAKSLSMQLWSPPSEVPPQGTQEVGFSMPQKPPRQNGEEQARREGEERARQRAQQEPRTVDPDQRGETERTGRGQILGAPAPTTNQEQPSRPHDQNPNPPREPSPRPVEEPPQPTQHHGHQPEPNQSNPRRK